MVPSAMTRSLAVVLGVLSSVMAAPTMLLPRQSGSGDVTFFSPGLGACGNTNSDSDFIVAVAPAQFDSFGNVCGRTITATTPDGHSVTVTVQDKCPGCQFGDLDMSPAAFDQLASPDVGRITGVTWNYN